MVCRRFAFFIMLVWWTYVLDGICIFIKWLEVVAASILLKDCRGRTALLIVLNGQDISWVVIFKVLLLFHINYWAGYGMNEWHGRLISDIISIVIRITCLWKRLIIAYYLLWNALIFWIKLIYIFCIDVVDRVTFGMSIPLIDLGEYLIQYRHNLLI
jgi:hypothetical protein